VSRSDSREVSRRRRQAVASRRARLTLLVFLAVMGVLTIAGAVVLWPSGDPPSLPSSARYAAPGVTFPRGVVTAVLPACPAATVDPGPGSAATPSPAPTDVTDSGRGSAPAAGTPACGKVTATVQDGAGAGQSVTIDAPTEALQAGLQVGDRIVLLRLPDNARVQGAILDSPYSYAGIDRATPLWLLAAGFVVAVVMVGRLRGLAALVSLVVGGVVLLGFVAPALLDGHSALLVAVVGSLLIMYVVLYLTHGLAWRTSTALAGTIVGVLLMAGAGQIGVAATRLTGVSDDAGGTLQALAGAVSLHDLVTCGIIIGGLGALNDITITQASAAWELSGAASRLDRRPLFLHTMRIGRDHLASTVYTLVFAYVGGAMPVLLLVTMLDRPWGDVLTSEDVATEIVRTICSAAGLLLAMPITTAIAVLAVDDAGPSPSGPQTAITEVDAGADPATQARPEHPASHKASGPISR
jgi:uncharacterized membrane protein